MGINSESGETMWGGRIIDVRWMAAGAVLAASAPSGLVEAQAVIGGEWREDVRAYAERLVDAGLAPGFGVAVAVDDWVVMDEGFGIADLATGRRVGESTPFYIASTTKALTGLAANLLVERGELDLDAPIENHIPGLRLPEGVEPGSILVRHLVTLTHGLSGGGPIVIRTAYTGDFEKADLPPLLRYHPPTGTLGEFSYDNLGYNLLGWVLEDVTGLRWQDAVEREVLHPIGMAHTTAFLSALDPDDVALPHTPDPTGGFERVDLGKDDRNLHAAGGHFATAGDMARLLAVELSGGTFEGRRALPAEAVLSTQEPHVAQDREFGPFHRHGWGYGWDVGTYGEDRLVHRFGSFQGYRSHVSFMPDRGVGVVVLTNGDAMASPATDLLATYIYDRMASLPELDRIYDERLDELVTQAEAGRRAILQDRTTRSARLRPLGRPLEQFAGGYESALLGRIEIREVAGGLEYRMGVTRGRAEVFDADQDLIRIVLGGSGVVAGFRFSADGTPAEALIVQGTEFARVGG